eukprot:19138_1
MSGNTNKSVSCATKMLLLCLILIGFMYLWFYTYTNTNMNVFLIKYIANNTNNTRNTSKIFMKFKQMEATLNNKVTKIKLLEQTLANTSLEMEEIRAKYSPVIAETNNQHMINRSKWHNCFISEKDESIISLTYDDKLDGASMNILLQKYLKTNQLKIFLLHFQRYPNLSQDKCGIPMQSFHVAKKYYYINNRFYYRNHTKETCFHPDFCVFYDYYALYSYIYDTYKYDNTTKWAMILEDDVTLCPKWINTTLNVLDETMLYEKYNYGGNKSIDFVYLGHGSTGSLVRISFIDILLQIMDTYENRQKRLEIEKHWHSSLDKYLPTWCKRNGYRGHCIASLYTVLFHPSGTRIQSTFSIGHNYSRSAACDELNTWSKMGMQALPLSGSRHMRTRK